MKAFSEALEQKTKHVYGARGNGMIGIFRVEADPSGMGPRIYAGTR